ncbi:MAG: GIY-YIG nuclease family protein [Candidatus Vogelbacteria bacterium]|nr:GIY-YIG nuclease family protein [Candidatus Vogelbacteria bacterium]
MFYVYILKSTIDNDYYVGSTNDLKKRFIEHNSGKVDSTSHRRPLELVYYEAYNREILARKRESSLKARGQARRWLLERIIS